MDDYYPSDPTPTNDNPLTNNNINIPNPSPTPVTTYSSPCNIIPCIISVIFFIFYYWIISICLITL